MSTIVSPKIVTKEVAVQLLNDSGKPVIFWDTCSLLDIIRLPIPDRKHSVGRLEKVMEIRQKIVSGEILSFASVLTVKEFNDHVVEAQNEVIRAARRISQDHNNYMGFVTRVDPTTSSAPIDLTLHNLEVQLNDIVQEIVLETNFIDRDESFLHIAEHRVIEKIAPAKVKGEFKDCYIWSTCLTIRQESSKSGHPFGFLSSNIRDYAEAPSNNLEPYLLTEATTADLLYYANIDVAYGSLKEYGIF
jgi:hypothetical protein